MKLIRHISFLLFSIFTLNGCLLISPYNNQVLSSRTQPIPFQAWTQNDSPSLRVECMPTNRFGPEISSYGSWTEIDTIPVSNQATLDLRGDSMYSAAKKLTLPESCWHQNGSNRWYYTSLRIFQDSEGSTSNTPFFTLNRDGVRCSAEAVADEGNWLAWFTRQCFSKYTSGNAIKWIVIRTNS